MADAATIRFAAEEDFFPYQFNLERYVQPYTGRPAIVRLLHIIRTSSDKEIKATARNLLIRRVRYIPDYRLHLEVAAIVNKECREERVLSLAEITGLQQAADEVMKLPRSAWDTARAENRLGRQTLVQVWEKYRDLAEAYASVGQTDIAYMLFCEMKAQNADLVGKKWTSILKMFIENGRVTDDKCILPARPIMLDCWRETGEARAEEENNIGQEFASGALSDALVMADLFAGLYFLGTGNFSEAAPHLISVGTQRGEPVASILAPQDIAIYATLCALATSPPFDHLTSLLSDEQFLPIFRQPPYRFLYYMIKVGLEGRTEDVAAIVIQMKDLILYDPFLTEHGRTLALTIIRSTKLRKSSAPANAPPA